MSIVGILILVVVVVVFLAVLGRHGWSRVMPVVIPLLAIVGIFLGYLLLARSSSDPIWRDGFRMQPATPVGAFSASGHGGVHFLDPLAQARPPIVRGRWSVLFVLVVLGGVAFGVLYQVRRGAWSWPAVAKVGAFGLVVVTLLTVIAAWRERSHARLEQEHLIATGHAVRVAAERPLQEAAAPERAVAVEPGAPATLEARRDVDTWRRESVLDFVPSSPKEMPDWCREDLKRERETVLVGNTTFPVPRPEGRDWVVGYSSQDPVMHLARSKAIEAAQEKLGLAALIQVKKAVPELDVQPLVDLAPWIVQRRVLGQIESTYVETATVGRERRPVGPVYRVAVRMRADPLTVDRVAREICRYVDRYGTGQPDLRVAFLSGLALAALAFSAFLVYVLIRAGSAGRWAYPLRIVSGGMLAAVIVAVVYVSVHLRVP